MKTKLNPIVSLLLILMPIFLLVGIVLTLFSDHQFIFSEKETTAFDQVENVTANSIPFAIFFKQLGIDIRYTTGETLQQGVFITSDGLMRNLEDPDDAIRLGNNQSLAMFSEFANEKDVSVYFAVFPTAGGVLQKKLPYSGSRVNQRDIIENAYNKLAGKLTSVNIYNILSENQDKYIFYRTEDNITSLGGYYVYQELIRRMIAEREILPLSQFNVSYENDYYGSLYDIIPYSQVKADTLSFYQNKNTFPYTLRVDDEGDIQRYQSLYPTTFPQGMERYLGGTNSYTEIENKSATGINLLVIGDNSASSYLPFMTNHYEKITFVNINESIQQHSINITDYDQILIGVRIEHYINSSSLKKTLENIVLSKEE